MSAFSRVLKTSFFLSIQFGISGFLLEGLQREFCLCGNLLQNRIAKNFFFNSMKLQTIMPKTAKKNGCRSILAKPADNICRRKEHSRTLKGIDRL